MPCFLRLLHILLGLSSGCRHVSGVLCWFNGSIAVTGHPFGDQSLIIPADLRSVSSLEAVDKVITPQFVTLCENLLPASTSCVRDTVAALHLAIDLICTPLPILNDTVLVTGMRNGPKMSNGYLSVCDRC